MGANKIKAAIFAAAGVLGLLAGNAMAERPGYALSLDERRAEAAPWSLRKVDYYFEYGNDSSWMQFGGAILDDSSFLSGDDFGPTLSFDFGVTGWFENGWRFAGAYESSLHSTPVLVGGLALDPTGRTFVENISYEKFDLGVTVPVRQLELTLDLVAGVVSDGFGLSQAVQDAFHNSGGAERQDNRQNHFGDFGVFAPGLAIGGSKTLWKSGGGRAALVGQGNVGYRLANRSAFRDWRYRTALSARYRIFELELSRERDEEFVDTGGRFSLRYAFRGERCGGLRFEMAMYDHDPIGFFAAYDDGDVDHRFGFRYDWVRRSEEDGFRRCDW